VVFSSALVSSINKTNHHDIAEILLKMALNYTITPNPARDMGGRVVKIVDF